MSVHRLLTVKEPWASPIVDGHKPVENRAGGFTRGYRGPLWIHGGAGWSTRGALNPLVIGAYPDAVAVQGVFERLNGRAVRVGRRVMAERSHFPGSLVLGRVDVVDAHFAEPGCCESPWAEQVYEAADGTLVTRVVHLVLANPHRVQSDLRVPGALGLWTPDRVPGLTEELDALTQEIT